MLTDVIRFEWRYHTRQVSFIAAALFFAGFGFALTATGFGPANVHINSPYDIAQTMGLISLAAVFAIAIFCANSVVRDREHQFEEIVFSTSVEKFPYLFGRFAGSFLAAFTVFSATAVGMMLAALLPLHDLSRVGAFSIIPYFWTLLVLVLPGMLVAAVTLFGIATLTRSVLASVVGAVAIYVFYFAAAAFTNSPLMAGSAQGASSAAGASLLDPFGLSAFFEQTRYWTPALRNTRLVSLTGNFLINRVLWLVFAAMVWFVVYKRFSFRVLAKGKAAAEAVHPDGERSEPVLIRPALRFGGSGLAAKLIAATRIELRSVLRSIPFLLLTLLWAGLAAMQILADVAGGEYGAAFYPTTSLILGTLRQPLGLVATVIIIYYSAELIWRERSVGMAEIVNATPAPNAVFVISKWIALTAMIGVLIATGLGVGIFIQLTRGFHAFHPALLFAFVAILGIPLMLFAMAAVLIQTLSPSKYFGLFAVLVAGVLIQAGSALGIEHPLVTFAGAPPLQYTEMNGFGASITPFLWFMTLWTAIGLLFLLAASALWRRAIGAGVFRTLTNADKWIAAIMASIAIAIAAFIFYNTNILNRWTSNAAALDWSADYERTFRAAATMPRPHIAAITADIALYPNERRYHITGRYDLVNDGATPIAKVLISVPRDARVNSLTLPSANVTRNDRFATYNVEFAHTLQPHAHVTLQFDLTYEHRGFAATAADTNIVANGSFITPAHCFPILGYRGGYEISDTIERKKRRLPPTASPDDDIDASAEWTSVDVTLSTAPDQIAHAPGRLIKEWTANDRRYFHYRSDAPIHNNLIFASARYAVACAAAGRTRIEVYYHPAHRDNVERILTAAADSIRIFEDAFGPYPQSQLRIAEAPAYTKFGGLAMPGLVFLSESRAFLIDARDPSQIDLVTRRTAHEVAHQWWGHSLTPAVESGASTIIESLPRYSELLVLDKRYGRGQVRRSLQFELDRYLAGRAGDSNTEAPLTRVTDQSHLYYGKGAIVMNALKELLGEETLNRALRGFVAAQSGPDHQPKIDDLLRAIEAVTPQENRALVNEWTRDVILYDLTMTSATSSRLPDGRFEVTMQATVHKSRADEHELPVNESIEFGIFATDPDDAAAKDILHLVAHPLHSGANTITVVVNKQPSFAAIDPYLTRIDRNRFDNVKAVAAR
ncbi:MAG: type transport system permease protein [Thermoanaerobaculia bacterium]|nr:type transport system permease protein [Thermoanaerobaculia bacterium]